MNIYLERYKSLRSLLEEDTYFSKRYINYKPLRNEISINNAGLIYNQIASTDNNLVWHPILGMDGKLYLYSGNLTSSKLYFYGIEGYKNKSSIMKEYARELYSLPFENCFAYPFGKEIISKLLGSKTRKTFPPLDFIDENTFYWYDEENEIINSINKNTYDEKSLNVLLYLLKDSIDYNVTVYNEQLKYSKFSLFKRKLHNDAHIRHFNIFKKIYGFKMRIIVSLPENISVYIEDERRDGLTPDTSLPMFFELEENNDNKKLNLNK